GFNPDDEGWWRVIASAAVDDELAIVPYGRGEYLAAIDVSDPTGDITATHRVWEKTGIGTDVPTPVMHGQNVLLLSDGKRTKGKLSYLDKKTGDVLWEFDLPRAKASYFASPVIAGEMLYCAREDGIIMACRLADGVQLLGENDMDESVIATPIPIRGKLLVRGEKHLFLIGD
ncbi:MAG: PQQ-binding-like beta-propeller repeat protein, partial [Planctomycetota bacterium]